MKRIVIGRRGNRRRIASNEAQFYRRLFIFRSDTVPSHSAASSTSPAAGRDVAIRRRRFCRLGGDAAALTYRRYRVDPHRTHGRN